MKRLLVVMGIMFVAMGATAQELTTRLGANITGSEKYTFSGESVSGNTNLGFSLGAEITGKAGENLQVGGGFEYLMQRKETDISGINISSFDSEYGFLPLYGTLKYSFPNSKIFGQANLGYDISFYGNSAFKGSATLSGGLYWALGVGVKATNALSIEMMYSTYYGTIKAGGTSIDFSYSPISLIIGYAFNL